MKNMIKSTKIGRSSPFPRPVYFWCSSKNDWNSHSLQAMTLIKDEIPTDYVYSIRVFIDFTCNEAYCVMNSMTCIHFTEYKQN